MSEIQQSPQYAQFLRSLKWQVAQIGTTYIYMKKFPFMPGIAKIQRADKLPDASKTKQLLLQEKIKTIAIEPTPNVSQKVLDAWCEEMAHSFTINKSPYLGTKTVMVDLSMKEDEIFHSFAQSKQRAVRRAQKAGVTIIESNDIQQMIRIKNQSAGFLGFVTTYGIDKLWKQMHEKNATIVLAKYHEKIVGGVLLLFYKDVAYYWLTGTIKEGKKQFAPTLLAWEAIKLSKKRGTKWFDFVGVWDERMPGQNISWQGFTKFKEGFGGKAVYYPTAALLK